jgi:hypothetical protein
LFLIAVIKNGCKIITFVSLFSKAQDAENVGNFMNPSCHDQVAYLKLLHFFFAESVNIQGLAQKSVTVVFWSV